MHVYDSIVDDDVLKHFTGWEGMRATGFTLPDYITNKGTVEAAVAFASLFWPAIVEDEELVVWAKYYRQGQIPELRARFTNDKSRIERWLNAQSLRGIFMMQQFSGDDEELVSAFGQALQLFWSLRLKTLFPTRTFVVELGEDIEGEDGPSITFYEAPNTDIA